MKPREELIKLVDFLRDKTGLTQKEVSTKAGYDNENRITQAISRKTGHEAVIKRLKMAFRDELQNVTLSQDEQIGRRTVAKKEDSKEDAKQVDVNAQSLEAILILAKANEKLADANQRQTRMLETNLATVSAPPQTFEVFSTMFANLQDVVLRIGTGERFESTNEVAALLHKSDPDKIPKVSANRTQNS